MVRNGQLRIAWLDSAKGIGIFLVVLGHTALPYSIFRWIFSFHIPLFFFLSGQVYQPEKYQSFWQFLKKKTRSLVLPYFLFSGIIYLYWLLVERYLNGGNLKLYQPALDILFSSTHLQSVFVPLWFLTTLFLTEIFFFLLQKIIRSKILLSALLLILSLIGYLYVLKMGFRLPWGIDIVPISTLFYALGFLIRNTFSNLKIRFWPVIIALLAIFSYFVSTQNNQVSLLNAQYGNFIYFLTGAVVGIILTVIIAQKWTAKFWQFLGRYSLIIFSFHFVILSLVRKLYNVIWPQNNIDLLGQKNIILGFSFTLICLLVFSGLIYILIKIKTAFRLSPSNSISSVGQR